MPVNKIHSHPLYFKAILPPEDIGQEVRKMKDFVTKNFGPQKAMQLEAHITLQIPIRMEEEKESTLVQELKQFCHSMQAFEVHLSGYGHFSSRAIYIAISNPQPLQKLHNALQQFLERHHGVDNHEKRGLVHPPHHPGQPPCI